MKLKLVAAAMTAVVGSGYLLTAWTQVKPEVLVKQRQAAMTLQGKYFGPLGGMAQGRVPFDAKIVQRNADFLGVLAQMPWDGFDPSTANEKSRAKPELFKEPEKVKQNIERFQAEVNKLQQVAKSGDEGSIKAQIGAVGKACGACHDAYREKQ
jgi:cytochrome c556